jgi:hypothetical protein
LPPGSTAAAPLSDAPIPRRLFDALVERITTALVDGIDDGKALAPAGAVQLDEATPDSQLRSGTRSYVGGAGRLSGRGTTTSGLTLRAVISS